MVVLDRNGIAELEEGDILELPARSPVIIKKDDSYTTTFKNLEELGKGKFGVVYKAKRKIDGEILAAKFVRKSASSKKEVQREIQMMNFLHHKRLIQLYDAYETKQDMIVVMELVTGGELFEKVVEEDHLTEKQVIRYIKQVLYGVQHMHRKYMVHLDLKPENILCLGGGKPGYEEIKLIDFGMTRVLKEGENETAMCGTPEFVAPEVITFNPITVQADMWSIGVITYVLLSGLSPFMGDDDNETLKNVTAGEYDFEDDEDIFEHLSDEVKLFIQDLLILNPRDRLTIDESLEHSWLRNEGSEKKLKTSNLKKFIARRRWQRTMNTIKAVSRLAGGLSLFGAKKSSSHGVGKGNFLDKVKAQQAAEEAIEDENVRRANEAAESAKIDREAAEKAQKEKEAAEKSKKEKEAAEKVRKEKEAAVKAQKEKETAEKVRKEKEAAVKAQKEKEAAEKARKEKEAAVKAQQEKEDAEKVRIEKEAADKAQKEKEDAEKALKEKDNEKDQKEMTAKQRKEKEASEKSAEKLRKAEEKRRKEEKSRKEKEEKEKLMKEDAEKKRKEKAAAEETRKAQKEKEALEKKQKEEVKRKEKLEKKISQEPSREKTKNGQLTDVERKKLRDEERKRRQEERRKSEENNKTPNSDSTANNNNINITIQTPVIETGATDSKNDPNKKPRPVIKVKPSKQININGVNKAKASPKIPEKELDSTQHAVSGKVGAFSRGDIK